MAQYKKVAIIGLDILNYLYLSKMIRSSEIPTLSNIVYKNSIKLILDASSSVYNTLLDKYYEWC